MYIIIGGGPTGISVAYHMHKKHKPYILLEKETQMGGICKSFMVHNMPFDYGVHYYSKKTPYVSSLLQSLDPTLRYQKFENKAFYRNLFRDTGGGSYLYPHEGGFDEIFKPMISACGLKPQKDEAIKIDPEKKVVETAKGRMLPYKKLISTMSLSSLVQAVKGVDAESVGESLKLKHTSLGMASFVIDRLSVSTAQHINNNDASLPFGRVEIRNNLSPSLKLYPYTGIQAEVSHNSVSDKDIMDKVHKGFIKMGLLKEGDKILAQDYRILDYAYPIGGRDIADKLRKMLEEKDIYSVGHFGSWRHITLDDAIREGKKIAEMV